MMEQTTSTMGSDVYDAFMSLGVDHDKAIRAATALNRRDADIVGVKSDINLLKWMVGGLYGTGLSIGLPLLWLLVRVATKVGSLN